MSSLLKLATENAMVSQLVNMEVHQRFQQVQVQVFASIRDGIEATEVMALHSRGDDEE